MQEKEKKPFNIKAGIPPEAIDHINDVFEPKGKKPYGGDASGFNGENIMKENEKKEGGDSNG